MEDSAYNIHRSIPELIPAGYDLRVNPTSLLSFLVLTLAAPGHALLAEETWLPAGGADFVLRFRWKAQGEITGNPGLYLRSENASEELALLIGPRGQRLERLRGPGQGALWEQQSPPPAHGTEVRLQVKKNHLLLGLDGLRTISVPVNLADNPFWRWQPAAGCDLQSSPRAQPLSTITLTDDFMREGKGQTFWETGIGEWAIQGSATPAQAANAFRFIGRGETHALTLNSLSFWFWNDLRCGVSLTSEDPEAAAGLALYAQDAENCHLVRWFKGHEIELVRVRGGEEHRLAQAEATRLPGNWYRLEAVIYGQKISVYVDGNRLFEAEDPSLLGGRVGLQAQSPEGVWFDDFLVESVEAEGGPSLEHPFGSSESAPLSHRPREFQTDDMMVGWSHPRSAWERSEGGLLWHRSRFFTDAAFEWVSKDRPVADGEICLLGEPGQPLSGYRLRWKSPGAELLKNGAGLARLAVPLAGLSSLSFSFCNQEIRLVTDGKESFRSADAQPLKSGSIGAKLGQTSGWNLDAADWRDHARASSTHHLEYLFESAPAAWRAQCGLWRSFNRWACVPMWSFFGGRDPDRAILWNKRRFQGDFDLAIAFAPMEGTAQKIHFAYPINLNVVFAADGKNLDSGYNLVFGAQDIPSRLYRKDKLLAENASRVIPRLRFDDTRLYQLLTRAWQRVLIKRRGNHLRILASQFTPDGHDRGMETLFEYTDTEPLAGEHLGVWTWGSNGIALARVDISFQDSPGLSALPSPAPARHSPEAALPAGAIETINAASGGSFRATLYSGRLDIAKQGLLKFRYRIPQGVELGLFVRRRLEIAQFAFAGPEVYQTGAVPLGRLEARTDDQWHDVEVDLRQALAKACPDDPLRPIDEIFLASPMQTLEQIAGLGVNRAGMSYAAGNLRLESAPQHQDMEFPLPPPQIFIYGVGSMDDFESGPGEWQTFGGPSGALLWRDPSSPSQGRYALRLFNPQVGGTAGARITRTPFDARLFPRLQFDYQFSPDLEINLVVRSQEKWFEIILTGSDNSWPVIGRVGNVEPDGLWHSAEFDLESALRKFLPGAGPLWVEGLYLADSNKMGNIQGMLYRIDQFCRIPAVSLEKPTEFTCRLAGRPPAAISHVFDDRPKTHPATQPTVQGPILRAVVPRDAAWLHLVAQTQDGKWSPPIHLPLLARKIPEPQAFPAPKPREIPDAPPPAPRIASLPSDRLCFNDFDWKDDPEGLGDSMGQAGIRRSAWVLPCLDDSAVGEGCLEIINLEIHDFFSAFFHQPPYDLRRYPRIAFDYKFEVPGCAVNLSGLLNKEMYVVEWLTVCRPGAYFTPYVVGRVARGLQDRQWHHLDFDLLQMVHASGRAGPSALPLTAEQLNTWAMQAGRPTYYNPLDASLKIDNFTIYSPRGRSPTFRWHLPGPSQADVVYAYSIDHEAATTPPEMPVTPTPEFQYYDLEPGRWFFHVRARDGQGRWGPSAHLEMEIAD